MSSPVRQALLALTCTFALAAGSAADQIGLAGSGEASPSIIERFFAHDGPPLQEYRARRTLRATNTRFKAKATAEAITELTRDGTFRYQIVREEGSSYVRSRVLHAVLKDEQRLWERRDPQRSTLSTSNYRFNLDDAAVPLAGRGAEEALIAITPLRRDMLLVDGRIVVGAESGDLLRVEGRLAKNPSFWTSRVDVVRRYARIAGVRVPVSTSSVAHVKIAGRSEFEMTYDYESINGAQVLVSYCSAGCDPPVQNPRKFPETIDVK